jgi:2-polyprenyl-3-methyl-5-hydroxy-6-metoxy-1,4-benzoquinol methylase
MVSQEEWIGRFEGDSKRYWGLHRERIGKVLKFAAEQKPKKVLDIGCGDGYFLNEAGKLLPGAELHGMDMYKTLKYSSIKFKKHRFEKKLPYNSNFFDFVFCGEFIEHLQDEVALMSELNRVLKPTGSLVLTTPNLNFWASRFCFAAGWAPFFSYLDSIYDANPITNRIAGKYAHNFGHQRIYNLHSLRNLLEKSNFELLDYSGAHLNVRTYPGYSGLGKLWLWLGSAADWLLSRRATLSATLILFAKKK